MSASGTPLRVHPGAMADLVAKIMAAGGCNDAEATATGEHLIGANLTGHDSHGLVRVPRYHGWLKDGTLNGHTALRTIADLGQLIQFDGDRGIGQYLAREATLVGIERARTNGSAIIALRHAGHVGRLGHYAEMAAAEGLVSIQFCNVVSAGIVAPYGSAQRHMSTNPVAVGVPNGADDPFILDFATSLVAEGKALVAATGGKPLPSNALIGEDGRETGDPGALYGTTISEGVPNPRMGPGALRTMGEHKGSGLALACDLIAGILTGNGSNVRERPFGNGWLAIFVDPARLDDLGTFRDEITEYVDAVRGSRAAIGFDRVRIPGDVERETRADRSVNGAPLAAAQLDGILDVARDAGISIDRNDLILAA